MTNAALTSETRIATSSGPRIDRWRFVKRNPTLVFGFVLLGLISLIALLAPLISGDPLTMKPSERLKAPSFAVWFGTDHLGRDVYARTVHGARVSLLVGICVALVSMAIGLAIGLMTGFFKFVETVVMRLMDGLMAIPVSDVRAASVISVANPRIEQCIGQIDD